MTQEALAERSGVSAQAIGALERGDRRYPQSQTAAMLARGLGVDLGVLDPPRRSGPPRRSPESSTELAPAPTRLIGREPELAAAADLLAGSGSRLLTITGPPGVGKTRLALAVAGTAGRPHWDEAVVVSLASLAEHELVAPTIVRRLGLRGERGPALETLAAGIRDRRLLLVLDNFEHLLPAALLVGDLLARCAGLRVLATSRGPLRLRGEQELPLAPLPLTDAVTLFVERARERCPDFELTPGTGDAVERICRRLDGLPLAIELAAPWTRLLGPRELLARLSTRLDLLVGGAQDLPERQRTMRGALQWSYELLTGHEQAVLRRVSVFTGGATPEAVETVCASDCPLTLQAIESLVDHGLLLSQVVDGEPRVIPLETVREHGRELLVESGEFEEAVRAHAVYFAALLEEAREHLLGADQSRWFARLERELDNLRAALRWASDHGCAELGLRMAVALRRFWDTHGQLREGLSWLELWLRPEVTVPVELRAQGLRSSGELAGRLGDFRLATERCEASLALYRDLDDRPGIARVLGMMATVAWEHSQFHRAARLAEESLDHWRALGNRWEMAYALSGLALSVAPQGERSRALALHQEALLIWQGLGERDAVATALLNIAVLQRLEGQLERAQALLQEAQRICREVGNVIREASVLHAMGTVAWAAGRRDQAARCYRQGLRIRFEAGVHSRIAQSLEGVAATDSDAVCAARLLGCANAVREAVGAPRHPEAEHVCHEALAELRQALGEELLRREMEAGRALSIEEACAMALA
jgi:predicted ATPase/DNA-binding XRE family transcriptional regulator